MIKTTPQLKFVGLPMTKLAFALPNFKKNDGVDLVLSLATSNYNVSCDVSKQQPCKVAIVEIADQCRQFSHDTGVF